MVTPAACSVFIFVASPRVAGRTRACTSLPCVLQAFTISWPKWPVAPTISVFAMAFLRSKTPLPRPPPGAVPADVLCLYRRQFLDLCSVGVRQALVVIVVQEEPDVAIDPIEDTGT